MIVQSVEKKVHQMELLSVERRVPSMADLSVEKKAAAMDLLSVERMVPSMVDQSV